MIYVLFGPPGVGKTYLGQLLSRNFDIPFFDADTLIDAEEQQLLQNASYDQSARDKFVMKLIRQTDTILEHADGSQNLFIAEAFTKEKNRLEFMEHFGSNVCYIRVETPLTVARQRSEKRQKSEKHVVNDRAFDLIWNEFEEPHFLYMAVDNVHLSDAELVDAFTYLIESSKRGRE